MVLLSNVISKNLFYINFIEMIKLDIRVDYKKNYMIFILKNLKKISVKKYSVNLIYFSFKILFQFFFFFIFAIYFLLNYNFSAKY